jgi:cell division protein FtsB
VTHGLYPPEELARVREANRQAAVPAVEEPRATRASADHAAPAPGWAAEATALRQEIETLRQTVTALTAEVQALKTALGA